MNMKCNGCGCSDVLRIPAGNPFRLHICRKNVAPHSPESVTFAAVDGLIATIVPVFRNKESVSVETEVTNDGDLLVKVPIDAAMRQGTYGVELSGTYQGNAWRWKDINAYMLVDNNDDSNVRPWETFGDDIYYLHDILDPVIDGDTLILITEGHAWIEGGSLTLCFMDNKSKVTKS